MGNPKPLPAASVVIVVSDDDEADASLTEPLSSNADTAAPRDEDAPPAGTNPNTRPQPSASRYCLYILESSPPPPATAATVGTGCADTASSSPRQRKPSRRAAATARIRTRTYVGITNDLPRRLRQHNGELVGGARYTRTGRPWTLRARVDGFADKIAALQFEWSMHHPRKRRLQPPHHGLAGRLGCARQLVARAPWSALRLGDGQPVLVVL